MKEIVFFLEERSARELIAGIIQRLAPDTTRRLRFIVFEGKQDLEKHLLAKLRGYLGTDARFIVMRDQDQEDCKEIKKRLLNYCKGAKRKATVRIACRTIEAFYLADLAAVEDSFRISGLARKHQEKARFRFPDSIQQPAVELERLTKGTYQKVSGSRLISVHLDLENTRSSSFSHLVTSIRSALDLD